MGTAALIALIKDDGSILATCVSSDGYLSWTGQKLLEFYKNEADVTKLVNQGEWGSLLKPEQLDGTLVQPILGSGLPGFPRKPDEYGFVNGFEHVYIFTNNQWFYREVNEASKLSSKIEVMLLAKEKEAKQAAIKETNQLTTDLADALQLLIMNPNSALYHNVAREVLNRYQATLS